jgi:hypothetical protein
MHKESAVHEDVLMLPLDSPRWSELKAAGGNTQLVRRLIEALGDNPTTGDWSEVWEQVSHQWSGYTVGFAAVPHLIRLAIDQGISTAPEFLLGLGRTVDSLATIEHPPADLVVDYHSALRQVLPIVERAAMERGYAADDYVCVLHAAAALSGRIGLGTQLFFALTAGSPELECPHCDAYLSGEWDDGVLTFQSVNSRMEALSEKVTVRPRQLEQARLAADSHSDTFNWLVDLCTAARQDEVFQKIRHLWGIMPCPLCASAIDVMTEIERNHSESENSED